MGSGNKVATGITLVLIAVDCYLHATLYNCSSRSIEVYTYYFP